MKNTIKCPVCQADFELSEAMQQQYGAGIRKEFADEFAAKTTELEKEKKLLSKRLHEVDVAESSIQDQIEQGIRSARQQLKLEERKKAEADLALEIEDKDTRLEELEEQLKQSKSHELELRVQRQ